MSNHCQLDSTATNGDGTTFSIRQVARLVECSPTTVKVVLAEMKRGGEGGPGAQLPDP